MQSNRMTPVSIPIMFMLPALLLTARLLADNGCTAFPVSPSAGHNSRKFAPRPALRWISLNFKPNGAGTRNIKHWISSQDVSVISLQASKSNNNNNKVTPSSSSSRTTTTDTSSTKEKRRSSNNTNNWQRNSYNDDAFGLVFLGGAFLGQDILFSGLFVTISAVAAIATLQGRFPGDNKRLAASVAGLTLILRLFLLLLHVTPPTTPFWDTTEINITSSNIWSEVALCSASMVYGFLVSSSSSTTSEEDK